MKHFAELALRKLISTSWVIWISICGVMAQDIPVGSWRTHFSYNNSRILEPSEDKLFCAAENGLFSIELSDFTTRRLSKLDGFADARVTAMKYNPDLEVLVVGYESGLVDFVFRNEIRTLREIFQSNLSGDKRINSIAFFENQTFLATGLGIVSVITDQVSIRENFIQIGPEGSEVTATELLVEDNALFAKTDTIIQRGNLNLNLLDFNNWTHYEGTADFEFLVSSNDLVYATDGSDIFRLDDSAWSPQPGDFSSSIDQLRSDGTDLYFSSGSEIYRLANDEAISLEESQVEGINDFVFVNTELWVATQDQGVVNQAGESIVPAGPISDDFSRLTYLGGDLYGFHAPEASTYDGSERMEGYSLFDDGEWRTEIIEGFHNVSSVASFMGMTYFGSIGNGIINIDTEESITNIPGSNNSPDSAITSIISGEALWVSSYQNQNPLHAFDGSNWTSLTSTALFSNDFVDLKVTNQEVIWALSDLGTITAYDLNENQAAILTGIPGSSLAIEVSIDDDGWVASSSGPANFPNASFVFEQQNVVLPSFDNRTLFEGESVSAIVTDAGNRVWFGTGRGLWLFDESISEQVSLFTIENSPLPSDVILDLEFDPSNGELFVLTSKGLVSYRSASTRGSNVHRNVNVFPNPVRPDYVGLVGIEGLANGVELKVTDLNGNLVKDLPVSGGSASWDLRNLVGAEVVTGIYLLFSSTSDGIETFVGKVAVVR